MPDTPITTKRRRAPSRRHLDRLIDAQENLAAAEVELERVRETRDSAIRAATNAGHTRRAVARVTGLSPGRVQQILTGSR
jgi:hypothetical protein